MYHGQKRERLMCKAIEAIRANVHLLIEEIIDHGDPHELMLLCSVFRKADDCNSCAISKTCSDSMDHLYQEHLRNKELRYKEVCDVEQG